MTNAPAHAAASIRAQLPDMRLTAVDAAARLIEDGWTPPPAPALTQEPADLAARVIDREDEEWARSAVPDRDLWFSLTGRWMARSWRELYVDRGPLRLWEQVG